MSPDASGAFCCYIFDYNGTPAKCKFHLDVCLNLIEDIESDQLIFRGFADSANMVRLLVLGGHEPYRAIQVRMNTGWGEL
jgi:hypothetical protein